MKSFLVQLAIRFLLRRLVPAEVSEKLELLVDTAEHKPLDKSAKFHFVKDAALKAVGQKIGGNQLNAAIELAVLGRKLRRR